jgi:hypothetical protein
MRDWRDWRKAQGGPQGQTEGSRRLKEIIAARQERRRKRNLHKFKKIVHHADCEGCGYPRLKNGKNLKTENDLWHEEYHETFKQDPLEGEAYEQAKVAAARACPEWFNQNFDNNSIPSAVGRMS